MYMYRERDGLRIYYIKCGHLIPVNRWGTITHRRSSHLRAKTDRRRYMKTYRFATLGIQQISPFSGVATTGSAYKLCTHTAMMMMIIYEDISIAIVVLSINNKKIHVREKL